MYGRRFESLTVLAMEYFRRRGVQFAVLETGLGGLHDSTNAVSKSILSVRRIKSVSKALSDIGVPASCQVVTSLALDHTHILGNSLEAIAAQKAGIIKRGQVSFYQASSIPFLIPDLHVFLDGRRHWWKHPKRLP